MDRLGTSDAGLFFAENRRRPLHLGLVIIVDGPAPDFADFAETVRMRLDCLPRYRQRIRRVPFGRPVWVDDTRFDLGYHLRHLAVPAPGDRGRLESLVARIMEQDLDLTRSPWELRFVDGLSGNRWAVVAKLHHCISEGAGGLDLLSTLFDVCPRTSWVGEPRPWHARPSPCPARLVAGGLADALTAPWRRASSVPRLVRELPRLLESLPATASRLARSAAPFADGRIGRPRRWTAFSVDLEGARRTGATVNELVLAAVAGGLRTHLGTEDPAAGPAAALPMFQIFTSDVAGPNVPLYSLGRRVRALYPYVPVAGRAPVSVGVISYAHHLFFGITGDQDAVPDLAGLARAIDHAFAEHTAPRQAETSELHVVR